MNDDTTSSVIAWSRSGESQDIINSINFENRAELQLKLQELMNRSHPQFKFISDWVLGLYKLKQKVPYFWENRFLATKLSVEQCSRWEAAVAKSADLFGKRCLDLTAGLGVDSFAFSKNFEQVIAIEENILLHQFQNANFSKVGCKNIQPILSTAEDFLAAQKSASKLDLVYIDPSRRDFASGKRTFLLQDISPNIFSLIPYLQNITNSVLIKLSPLFDISEAVKNIPFLSKIQVFSWEGECKELLAMLDFLGKSSPIVCAKVMSHDQQFEYEENRKLPEIPILLKGGFLYLVDAAVRKSGLFKEVFWEHFDVSSGATHRQSGIFISNNNLIKFPGKSYHIIDMFPFQKRTLKQFIQSNSFRNHYTLISSFYPYPIDFIKKELHLLDSNKYFLLLTETVSGAVIYVLHKHN